MSKTLDKARIIKNTEGHVKKLLAHEGSGHDWWHVFAVRRNAFLIQEQEGGDKFVIEMAALLHDVDDPKLAGGNREWEPRRAKSWLVRNQLPKDLAARICNVIRQVSFKGAGVEVKPKILEAKIVQDADRLEALGAIGIARTFAVGGMFQRPIFDPKVKPRLHRTKKEYQRRFEKGTSVNHFYEKILLLKDRLNTKTAKQIARRRHDFVLDFLKEFFREWEGKA